MIFQKVKLGDVITFKNGKGINDEKRDKDGKYLIYGSNGVIGKTNEVLVEGKNIIIGRVGAYCGSLRYIDQPSWITDNAIYGISSEEVDDRYMYLLLTTLDLRNYAGGSAQPLLNQTVLKNISVDIPNKTIQTKIADILFNLLDFIKLNNSINETLETLALTLYNNWFIDFGPFQDDEFVESELGIISNGWEVKKLKDISNILMGQSPKSEFYNQIGEGLPFHQGVTNFGNRFPTNTTYSSKLLRVAQEGDFLISVRAPVGRINIAHTKMVIGRGLSAISSKTNTPSYLLYTLKVIFNEEDRYGSGTIFNSINKGELENLKVIVPDQKIMNEYEDKVSKIDQLIKMNHEQTIIVTNTTDYLLPRLISGEIDISEAAEIVKEVILNEQPEPSV
ncbi:restriction endonuclease subunit S [Alkalihalobacillus sp. NPDC078783]